MRPLTERELYFFMKILVDIKMPEPACCFIAAAVDDNVEKADRVVDYIKANPTVSESDLLKKTQEICKNIDYDKRIQTFSKSTMQLIMDRMTSEENLLIIRDIVLSSDTEEEVVKRLKEELN